LCITGMPATKLIKFLKAVMRQNTKIRGTKDILIWTFALATIIMPVTLWSQPVPEENEWVVVIDAGHGGKDPGAVGAISREKNINLAVALKAGKYISENLKDVKVIYTRKDDTFIGLAERAEVANKNKADIFISIHSNAISDKRFTGAETYVLGQSMDDANLQVAMKENSVITFEQDYQTKYEGYDPNSVESFIIFSLMQNTYLKQSTEFATMIQNQFRDRVGRKDRGVRQAGFVVLWRTTMPSVLIELGFISNPEEEKYLNSSQGQDYLASAIFRAFRDYKQTIDSRSGIKRGNSVRVTEVPETGAGGQGNTSARPVDNSARPVAEVKGSDTTAPAAGGKAPGQVQKPVQSTEQSQTQPSAQPPSQPPAQSPELQPVPSTAGTSAGTPDGTSAGKQGLPSSSGADDIFFMVQISAMPRNREMDQYLLRGIETVTKIDDGERIKYAAGKFPVYDDAIKYRRTLVLRFPDAFVIAVRNGKTMPLREAIEAKKQK
jgi:N-acetylmuramoyl-L-alanine amidase